MLKPGATIGILGGGQLGRMLALAGARLGLRSHIFAPERDSPAFEVAAGHTIAPYDDYESLARFAGTVDAVTFEFENVPAAAVALLEEKVPVRPGSKALRTAQDRILEKRLARELGARTADFAEIDHLDDLRKAVARLGLPAILKTRSFGYDGKGQIRITAPDALDAAYAALKGAPAILEKVVPFDLEVSVVAARSCSGGFAAYEAAENEHSQHILRISRVPARVRSEVAAEAVEITTRIAEALDYVGVLGVEFFISGTKVYVNEIAPRVHNSGHWTLDGAVTSQFEQHMRAVAGMPLGAVERLAETVSMTNLIGDDMLAWPALLAEPGARLHLYGKHDCRPGRKMGHVTRLGPRQA